MILGHYHLENKWFSESGKRQGNGGERMKVLDSDGRPGSGLSPVMSSKNLGTTSNSELDSLLITSIHLVILY